jgi:hypothetical protein
MEEVGTNALDSGLVWENGELSKRGRAEQDRTGQNTARRAEGAVLLGQRIA